MPPTTLLGVLYLLVILVWDIILYKLGIRKKSLFVRTEEEEAEIRLQIMMQNHRELQIPTWEAFREHMAEHIGEGEDEEKFSEKDMRELYDSLVSHNR